MPFATVLWLDFRGDIFGFVARYGVELVLDLHECNIFSCKDFDPEVAANFTKEFFKAQKISRRFFDRV